jgi:hypothetical protein
MGQQHTQCGFTEEDSYLAQDHSANFSMLLTPVHNLKLLNYLYLEFSIEYFWTADDYG